MLRVRPSAQSAQSGDTTVFNGVGILARICPEINIARVVSAYFSSSSVKAATLLFGSVSAGRYS